ncbi:LEA type 2 family protein [Treponema sp. R80B11-R83G3]
MKKKLLLMAAVLICGLMCTTCSILAGLLKDVVKAPEVTLKSVDFSKIDFNGLTLLSTVDVKNDNSIDIPLPKIDWDLSIVNNPFVKGIIESNGSLKSRGSTQVQFPVSFTYVNLIKAITSLNDNNASYKIKMIAHIPIKGLGDLSFPLEHEGKLPLLRLPDISIAAAPSTTFTYGSIPGVPTGANISLALNVKNNSNIAVKINDLSYVLQIGNTSLSRVGITGSPNIKSGATEKITFQLPVALKDLTAIGVNVLKGNFNFNLTGNYKFGLPDFPFLNDVGDSFSLRK